MEKQTVKVKMLREGAKPPCYGSELAAGADLRACIEGDVTILPGQTVFVGTGIALQIPEGLAGFIYARSGMASKHGLAPANKVGVIDSDYRGEVIVALYNHGTEAQTVKNNDRIAQLVIAPYIMGDFAVAESLDGTLRGAGGFGSTGVG